MKDDVLKAYAEVDEILYLLDKKYLERVPLKIRNFFKKFKLKDNNPNINIEVPLNEQCLQRKTFVFLAILYLNYWCNSEEEKQDLLRQFSDNGKRKEQELREKYNPENLFKKEKINTKQEQMDIIEYKKDNFIKRILSRILKIFKK